ncbi:MAG: LegC family aminotransferase [Bacteroidota bacterium]
MTKFQPIVNFIRKTFNSPKDFIPLHAPVFCGNEKKYLEECIDTTFVSSVGKFVDRFEAMVAEYTGATKAVVCVNGTNALHLAMLLLGVKQDDEVITQPLTFIATCNAISYIGAHPVFVDVDLDTLGMSPKALRKWLAENVEFKNQAEDKVNNFQSQPQPQPQSQPQPQPQPQPQSQPYNKTTGRRIKACIPMHTFGHPCRIDEIVEICKEYHIELIEDAAESLGSFYKEKHTGTFAKIAALSFNGNKTITTGGGGMLLFQDEDLAKSAKHLTTQAKVPHPWNFVHDQIGYNYRMPNINAALGCAQMEQLPQFLSAKRQLAHQYEQFFSTLNSTSTFFKEPQNAKSNYWLNVIILKDRDERDEFLKFANDNGVMTRPAWQLMNKLPMFVDCQCGELPNSEWLEDRIVNIPSSAII